MKYTTAVKHPLIIRFRVLDKMWVKEVEISNYFDFDFSFKSKFLQIQKY